tara:strand:- start:26 stop:472 length:447 start_codon:yes stop_codon:yes gene_type:complete
MKKKIYMRNFLSKNLFLLNKIILRSGFIRYGITGAFFSILGPLFFIILSNFFSRILVILLIEPPAYALKFFIYRYWVYRNKKVFISGYLLHITPLYFISIFITKLTSFIDKTEYVAFIIILVNGIVGYLWGKFLYSNNNFYKNRNLKL